MGLVAWHSVLLEVILRVVFVRRATLREAPLEKYRHKFLEAFFTTRMVFTEAQMVFGEGWGNP